MARKQQRVKYGGGLAKPVYESSAGSHSKAVNQVKEKFEELFLHYEINPNSDRRWRDLAIALAVSHVPGINILPGEPPKRGQPKTWQAGLGDELLDEVEAAMRERGFTRIRDALKYLRNNKDGAWHQYTLPNLETRHREAARRRSREAAETRRPLYHRLARELASSRPPSSPRGLFALGEALAGNKSATVDRPTSAEKAGDGSPTDEK